ncbi:MAG: hypothetical protein K9M11_02845 [Candidatus Pacebacteria bacterium]|nr:hypothetical protein [Candidatus Paceibacterota bacterium]
MENWCQNSHSSIVSGGGALNIPKFFKFNVTDACGLTRIVEIIEESVYWLGAVAPAETFID